MKESNNLAEKQPERVAELAANWRPGATASPRKCRATNPDSTPNPQAADGTITLPARTAEVHGVMLRYEPLPHKNTLGFWTRADDFDLLGVHRPPVGRVRRHGTARLRQRERRQYRPFSRTARCWKLKVPETGGFQKFEPQELGRPDVQESRPVPSLKSAPSSKPRRGRGGPPRSEAGATQIEELTDASPKRSLVLSTPKVRTTFSARQFIPKRDERTKTTTVANAALPGFAFVRVPSGRVEFRDAILWARTARASLIRARQPELHDVRIFVRVVVMAAKHANGLETLAAKEELGVQVGLADFDHDFAAALLRQLVDQPADHLTADALMLDVRRSREIEDPQLRFMQLINHEAHDAMIALGDHADAVPLAKATQEIFFVHG